MISEILNDLGNYLLGSSFSAFVRQRNCLFSHAVKTDCLIRVLDMFFRRGSE